MKILTVILIIFSLSISLYSQEKVDEKEANETLKKIQTTWNSKDMISMLSLYHKDSRLQKGWNQPKIQPIIEEEFGKMIDLLGTIESIELGKYDENKKLYEVTTIYKNKGKMVGTVSFKKEDKKVLILDLDVDG